MSLLKHPIVSSLYSLWAKYQVLLFILGWFAISLVTLTPMDELPEVPGSDKLHHVIGFACWTIMVAAGNQQRFKWLCLGIVFWGGMIELLQPYVNRHREFADLVADSTGVILVLAASILIRRWYLSQQKTA